MNSSKIKNLKVMCNFVKEKVRKYKIYQIKIKTAELKPQPPSESLWYEWTSYVELFENILAALDKESTKLITDYFIKSKSIDEMPGATSTFYSKLRCAVTDFIDYFQ